MKKLLSLLIIATIITSSLCVSYFAIDDNSTQNNTESTTVPVTETSSTVTTEPVTESSTDTSSTEPTDIKVNSIKLNTDDYVMYSKQYVQLKATVSPDNATNNNVTWKSSNKNVATVDKNGKVVAKHRGTCRITVSATDGSGVKAVCKVTVKQLVTSIKLNKSVINLNKKGNKATLKATIKPNNADNKKVTWSVKYPKNVSYNAKKGIVKASRNNCYSWVFVKATDGSKKGAKVLVVVGRKANKVEIGKTVKQKVKVKKSKKSKKSKEKTINKFVKLNSINIISGKSFTFSKRVTAKNNKSVVYGGVTWKSSNPKILTIDGKGRITTVKTLSKNKKYVEVDIYAKTMDGSNLTTKCKVKVCQSVKDLYVSSNQVKEVPIGRNVKFNVGITPSNVYNRKLTFSSNKTSVATVDAKGYIKGIKKGKVNITAKATDGSNEKVVMEVNVIKVPIETVTHTDKKEVNVGNTLKLGINIKPNNASYSSIKYSSSNEKVATVSKGVVKGISRGKVIIKASIKLGNSVIKTIKFNIKVNPKPITMNTRLTHKQFVSNKEYVDMYCKALNDYFESCGAVINPNMVGYDQWCVDDTSEFSDNMKIYDFMVESVGIWTHRMAKDNINNNGSWKDLKKGESLTNFLEEIGRIGSSNISTYNPEKMLNPKWNGWKQECEYNSSDDIFNVYVYPSKIKTSAGTEYVIYMYWGRNWGLKRDNIPLVKE